MIITSGKSRLEPARAEHLYELADGMPPQDVFDLARGWQVEPLEAATTMLDWSDEAYSIFYDGRIVAMFGIQESGLAWLMRAEGMERAAVAFIRHAPKIIDKWLAKYGKIEGFLSKDYVKFIRWFRWAGFGIEDLGNGYVGVSKWA